MNQFLLASLLALWCLPGVFGQGTTISVPIIYCAPTFIPAGPSSHNITNVPYILYASEPDGQKAYVTTDGHLTLDPLQATFYSLTSDGKLVGSGGLYISTSPRVQSAIFEMASIQGTIMGTFTVVDSTLTWLNEQFVGGKAAFCVDTSYVLYSVFNTAPPDCLSVNLTAMPAASFFSPNVSTTSVGISSTSTLEDASALPPVESATSSGTSTATSTTSTIVMTPSPTPTTTGSPNCFERSIYDGAINEGFLILCHTGIDGALLDTSNETDIAACIGQCSSYVQDGLGPCVAMQYDTLATSDSCHLFYSLSPIIRGGNATLDSAILVNEPFSPIVSYVTSQMSSSSSTTTYTSSKTTGASQSTREVPVATRTLTESESSTTSTSESSSTNTSTTSILTTTITSTPSLSTTSTSATTTTTSSTVLSSKSCPIVPLSSPLCPDNDNRVLNLNADGHCYSVFCNSTLSGTILSGNSTTASSTRACIGFCSLYNIALPYGCQGVNYLGTMRSSDGYNCLLLASVGGATRETDGVDAVVVVS